MSIFLYDAVRSPRGKARADGGLAALKPHALVAQLEIALEERVALDRERIDGLILGCVGQVGAQGGNVAQIAKRFTSLPDRAFAFSVNNFCASGLTAIGQAVGAIASGAAETMLAGGVESMSQVPFLADHADYYADVTFPERGRYFPVALAADRLALAEKIDRPQLDDVALRSQLLAEKAELSLALQRSRIALKNADGVTALDRDECLRAGTTSAGLAKLQPAFGALGESHRAIFGGEALSHLHTMAHAPPMADGAGLAVVSNQPALGSIRPRARIVSFAEVGGDLNASLLAGFAALDIALKRARVSLAVIDRFEFMEAFAVTLAKFFRDTQVDRDKVNVAGGHLARGHALGATGAILLSSLLDALDDGDGSLGAVVVTGAAGVGAAMIVERLA